MLTLAEVDVSMTHFNGRVRVVEWRHGDPFPRLGASVGIDTETERFSDTVIVPPLVVLGVFDAASSTCYEVYWRDAAEFLRGVCLRDTQQRYFNLGFDELVLSAEDPDKPLLTAIEQGRVRDMQIRAHLHEIATIGFIRGNVQSLAGCTLEYENWTLDKGDGSDDSARLSFHRSGTDGGDYRMTDEQAVYLMYDCVSTWCLGEAIPEQATELQHTKGMVVLAHISANGLQVDPVVFADMSRRLTEGRDRHLNDLMLYGFPNPETQGLSLTSMLKEGLRDRLRRLDSSYWDLNVTEDGHERLGGPDGAEALDRTMSRNGIRRLLLAAAGESDEWAPNLSGLHALLSELSRNGARPLGKADRERWDRLCEDYALLALDQCRSMAPLYGFMRGFLDSFLSADQDCGSRFADAASAGNALVDDNPGWLSGAKPVGPRKFFQDYIAGVLQRNPRLELDRTEKNGEIKLTQKDMWRLEDLGIEDGFLNVYTGYNHCVKYLSTYMKPEFIKPDGRVHSRYVSILRTARTSCNGPLTYLVC